MIVPIGRFCGIVMQLRRLGLRVDAYPFDWMVSDLYMICDSIETDFKDFFDVIPEKRDHALNGTYYMHTKYRHKRKGIGFPHHDMYDPKIKETFTRRIERWKTVLSTTTEKVTFAHTTFNLDMDEVKYFIDTIQKYYPQLQFHMIIVHEFADDAVDTMEKEYVIEFDKQELFTIYNIHMKEQEQARFPSSDKFYDIIFKSFIENK